MKFKKFFLGAATAISAYLLFFALLFLANSLIFRYVTANPTEIKSLVKSSGTYDRLPELIYDNARNKAEDQAVNVKLTDPEVKQAALESFNSQFYKENIENAIDQTYAWLEGKSEQLEFSVDIEEEKTAFISKIVDARAEKTKQLPKCTSAQLRQMALATISLYTLECLPPGVDIETQAERAKTQLQNSREFLADTKFEAKDLKDSDGQPLARSDSQLRQMFQTLKNLPVFLTLASIFFLGIIYYASSTPKAALKRVAKIFISAGIILLAAPFITQFLYDRILPLSSPDKIISEIAGPIAAAYNDAAAVYYYWLGGLITFLGAGLIIALKYGPLKDKKSTK